MEKIAFKDRIDQLGDFLIETFYIVGYWGIYHHAA
jgi:hypothetical protein